MTSGIIFRSIVMSGFKRSSERGETIFFKGGLNRKSHVMCQSGMTHTVNNSAAYTVEITGFLFAEFLDAPLLF